ncbi:MAG: mevalonate kinase [Bacillota bacterium]
MTIDIPGKLFISGEYAVLYGAHAVLAPVERTMTFECVPGRKDTFVSSHYGPIDLENTAAVPESIRRAYTTARDYLRLKGIPPRPFLLRVKSALDHKGRKLGLGSSGALTVGIIRSIAEFHGAPLEKDTLYKLSVLSQRHQARHASFADIAVSVHGAWILYRRFDRDWFNRHADLPLEKLLKSPWPKLLIKPFRPGALHAFAVNSLHPASSKALVETFMHNFDEAENPSLIDTVDQLSLTLYNELRTQAKGTKTLSALDQAYDQSMRAASVDLKPVPLKTLMTTINAFGGVSKISGAGGGDCVLAFFEDPEAYKKALDYFTKSEYPCIHFRRNL